MLDNTSISGVSDAWHVCGSNTWLHVPALACGFKMTISTTVIIPNTTQKYFQCTSHLLQYIHIDKRTFRYTHVQSSFKKWVERAWLHETAALLNSHNTDLFHRTRGPS